MTYFLTRGVGLYIWTVETAGRRRGWYRQCRGHGRSSPLTSQIHRRDVSVAERRFIGVATDTKHEIVDGIVGR